MAGETAFFCRNFCLVRETFLTSDFDHGHKIFIQNVKICPLLSTFEKGIKTVLFEIFMQNSNERIHVYVNM